MEAMLGMIILWPISWVPEGFHLCDGTTLPVQQYQALYSLLGKTYGGDGVNNFALPNMMGMFVRGSTGSGSRVLSGGKGGAESVALSVANLPAHSHQVGWCAGNDSVGTSLTMVVREAAARGTVAVTPTGTGVPVKLLPPYIDMAYIICISGGEYPVQPG